MRFATPPRELTLGGFRLGVTGARGFIFSVLDDAWDVAGCPWVDPGGGLEMSVGALGSPGSSWEVLGRSLASARDC